MSAPKYMQRIRALLRAHPSAYLTAFCIDDSGSSVPWALVSGGTLPCYALLLHVQEAPRRGDPMLLVVTKTLFKTSTAWTRSPYQKGRETTILSGPVAEILPLIQPHKDWYFGEDNTRHEREGGVPNIVRALKALTSFSAP